MSNPDPLRGASRFALVSLALHLCMALLITGYQGPSGAGGSHESFTEVGIVRSERALPEAEPPASEEASDGAEARTELPADEIPVAADEPAAVPEVSDAPETANLDSPAPLDALDTAQAAAASGSEPAPAFGIPIPLACMHPRRSHHGMVTASGPYVGYMGGSDGASDLAQYSGGRVRMMAIGEAGGPSIRRFASPAYPAWAARYNVEGQVVLQLYLDSYGVVQEVMVVEAAGYGLDEAAVNAAFNSKFGPAVVDGRPVACYTQLTVVFDPRQYSN